MKALELDNEERLIRSFNLRFSVLNWGMDFENTAQTEDPRKEKARQILKKMNETDRRIEYLKTAEEYRALKGRHGEAAQAARELKEAKAEKERLLDELMESQK